MKIPCGCNSVALDPRVAGCPLCNHELHVGETCTVLIDRWRRMLQITIGFLLFSVLLGSIMVPLMFLQHWLG